MHAAARSGEPVHVVGRFAQHPRYGAQVTLRAAAGAGAAPSSPTISTTARSTPWALGEREADLRAAVGNAAPPALRAMLEGSSASARSLWRASRATAAALHQAYRHGLLEHRAQRGKAAHLLSGTFPGVDQRQRSDRGAAHDIGK